MENLGLYLLMADVAIALANFDELINRFLRNKK